jgi:hypothetical protein
MGVYFTRENEEVDLALSQLCGQDDDGDGKVQFSTYWERVPGINSRVSFYLCIKMYKIILKIWFPGSPESDQQKAFFEREGFRLISLCGYSVRNVS